MNVLVHYTGKNVYYAESLRFVPGLNEVSLQNWQKSQRNKLVVKRLELGVLKIQRMPSGYDVSGNPIQPRVSTPPKNTESAQVSNYSLANFNAQQAGEIIGKTFDPSLLEKWLEQESRKGVAKIISDRMTELDRLTAPRNSDVLEDDEDAEEEDE